MSTTSCYLPFLLILITTLAVYGQNIAANVTVNWTSVIGLSDIVPSVNVIVSPLLLPESPIFDQIWQSLLDLNTSYLRVQEYRYYPRLCIAQLEPPSGKYLCKHLNGDSFYQNWNVTIKCPSSKSIINDIQFASYGNPNGNCGNFTIDPKCHYNKTLSIVKSKCLNKNNCTLSINDKVFGNNTNDEWCIDKNINLHSFSVQVTCDMDYNYSNWDFTQMDKTVNTFMNKFDNSIMLFSAKPDWEFSVNQNIKIGENVTDNPYNTTLNYCQKQDGCYANHISNVTSKTGLVHYLTQIINWYQNGTLIDEYDNIYKNTNKLHNFSFFEVLNEPDIFNEFTIEQYTSIYDNLLLNIKNTNIDPYLNKIKYVGLTMADPQNKMNWFNYFLNKSNHLSDQIPIDYISFHHYASLESQNRNNPSTYSQLFKSIEYFIYNTTVNIAQIKNKLHPSTKLIIDELGTMLQPTDSDLVPPSIYYNFAGAYYLYGITELMKINKLYNAGIITVHNSAYIGYPYLKQEYFPLSPGGVPPMWVSLSSLNWTNGVGNAKYWAQKMYIDHIGLDSQLIETMNNNQTCLYSQGFINSSDKKLILLINKCYQNIKVTINEMDNGGIAHVVDETTGDNPARQETLTGNELTLMPYVVVITYIN